MNFVNCTHDRHAGQILAIFNEAIATSTALYDYHPRAPESMGPWFANREKPGFPVIGVEDDAGTLLAFATYGPFRAFPAYKYTVEHSVYVHRDHRGGGLGTALLQRLIEHAVVRGVHVMVGAIDVHNTSSIQLHERLGFVHAGTIRQAGFKFGHWLDVAFYQLTLASPAQPVDG